MASKQMALLDERSMSQFTANMKISRTVCRMTIENILVTIRNILVTMRMLGMASGGLVPGRQVADSRGDRAMPQLAC